jgi:Replication initiator protein A
METTHRSKPAQPIEKLYIENTLLRVSGALFCHDPKRAASRTQKIELSRGTTDKHMVIRPDPEYGQPGQLAHKVFVALIKKHSDYGRPIQKQISFTKREIMRAVGRGEWGGRDSEELSRALHQIHHTFVKTYFKNRAGKFTEHSFNIFPEIMIERRQFASDPIEACTVTLAEPILASLDDEHFTCLNHPLMQELGTIGQALYMRLFFHFANLYDGRNRSTLAFPKRYDDICSEWLGGLTVLRHKSKIISEQLGRHLVQLVQIHFLTGYGITPAKNGEGFVVTFFPGRAFFDDYDRFYRSGGQVHSRSKFKVDHSEIERPMKVAYLFAERRTGKPATAIPFVGSKEVATAKQLLGHIAFEEMPAFLDYALAEAKSTRFDVQSLGGLKQYVAGYLAGREQSANGQAREATRRAKETEEKLRDEYEQFRRTEAARILANLPEAKRDAIEHQAELYVAKFKKGGLHDQLLEVRKRMLTAQRYGDRIKSFDEWRGTRSAA